MQMKHEAKSHLQQVHSKEYFDLYLYVDLICVFEYWLKRIITFSGCEAATNLVVPLNYVRSLLFFYLNIPAMFLFFSNLKMNV